MMLRPERLLGAFLFAAISAGLSFGPAAEAASSRPVVVVELFTSQGCSSCPPADKLLKTFSERKDVVALSYNVDYWDYLGWKDTLARPEYSARQRTYAKSRGDGQVYTPQIVINGLRHAVGSQKRLIEKAIERTREDLKKLRVPLSMKTEHGALVITAGDAPEGVSIRPATIWLALVKKK